MPTIVTTVSGASSNSYNTIAEINAHAETTEWASSWEAAEDDQIVFAIRAARALDLLPFPGYPTSEDQAMQHPRIGLSSPRGTYYDSAVVHPAIKRAHAHIAAWLSSLDASADPFNADSTAKIKSLAVGPIEIEFRDGVGAEGGTFLATVIAPMLRSWGLIGAAGTVRLTR